MYGVPLAIVAFIFVSDLLVHHILRNIRYIYVVQFAYLCYFLFTFSFIFPFRLFFIVWLVLLCSRTRYASTSPALPEMRRFVSQSSVAAKYACLYSLDQSARTDVVGQQERFIMQRQHIHACVETNRWAAVILSKTLPLYALLVLSPCGAKLRLTASKRMSGVLACGYPTFVLSASRRRLRERERVTRRSFLSRGS